MTVSSIFHGGIIVTASAFDEGAGALDGTDALFVLERPFVKCEKI